MHDDDPQKREIINRRHFSFRLNLFFFATFAVFSILVVRLAILQFVEGPALAKEGTNIGTNSIKIPPIRGNIYDSTGYPIAYSTSTQTLYFTIQPGFNTKETASYEAYANKLLEVFNKYGDPAKAMSLEDIIEQMDLTFRRNFMSTPRRIKTGLTKKEIAYFLENRNEFPGVDIVEESVRNYDQGTIAVQLVGYLKKFQSAKETFDFYKEKLKEEDPRLKYLNEEDVGEDGLEFMYQDQLRGKNGLKTYPVNAEERIIGPVQITNPEKGNNLYLTINKNVQVKTEEAIMSHLKQLRNSNKRAERAPYAKTGFAVAMEVQTGKVVTMASMPDYDPNIWAGGRIKNNADFKNIESYYKNGTIRQVYTHYDDPKEFKKHPSSLVPPGSTLKPLSVLVGLSEKLFSTSSTYQDRGVFYFGRKGHEQPIRNAQNHVYGALDPARAIAKSSNPFMAAMIGNGLYKKYEGEAAIDKWDKYMKEFGLGVSTESGLIGETNGVIDYTNIKQAGSVQASLVFASFGQMGKYTTLQLAQYASMLANHGKRMKPQFVNEIKDAAGKVVQGFKPEVLNKVELPEAYWDEVERGMSQVGVQGFDGVKYSFNRKTGTSQQDVGGKTVDNAVFIAYAPAENPVLAVAVVVPDGGFGGWGAAPIARQIFDAYDAEVGLYGKPNKAAYAASSTADTGEGNAEQ
ncbi:peptidoglycan D,D-transpeptidase FtsI family protein [Paenibacillus sp. GCM10023252]|uniref:peptidoglycan D,D-transpeptidase FtsI family protein n=1 Tax=Paenibacillus sp. GCM10023252 TaxID=3252649 RepID=UPI00360D3BB8